MIMGIIDRVSREGKAIVSIRLSVCPFVLTISLEPTDI